MANKLKCNILFAIILSASAVFGQVFHVTLFTEKDGLPPGKLNDIYQDSSGFVWLATDQGLIQFNGKTFTTTNKGIFKKFAVVSDGSLAIGEKEILTLKNGKESDSQFSAYLNTKGFEIKSIISIEPWNNGKALWLLCSNGLYQFENKTLIQFNLDDSHFHFEECILSSANGILQLVIPDGSIYQWHSASQKFVHFTVNKNFEGVEKLISYNDTLCFLLTKSKIFKLNNEHKISELMQKGLPPSIHITDVTKFNDRILISSADHGLWLGRESGQSFSFSKVMDGSEPHRMVDLPFKDIRKIVCDDANIWLICSKGLALLRERPFKRISSDVPLASFEQAAFLTNGQIYLESDDGLFECRKAEGENEYIGSHSAAGLNQIVQAVTAHDNRLWVAKADFTLFYFEDNKYSKLIDLRERGDNVFYMYPDRTKNVWVSQAQGTKPITGVLKITHDLVLIDYGETKGFQSRVLATKESPYGQLFCAGIGEKSYLYQYVSAKDRFINISAEMEFDYGENFEVHDLAIGTDSVIWLASTAGLLRYKNKTIEKIYFDELYENEVVAITVANDGMIWFSTDRSGVVRYDGHNNSYTLFDQKSGFASNFMTYRSIYSTEDGTIWVGSREGFFISYSGSVPWKKTGAPIIISVTADGQKQNGNTFSYKPNLTFDFVSLTFPVKSIQYAYRLIGYNNDRWTNLLAYDSLVLSNLKDGNYRLEIKARQVGGYQWSDPLIYNFSVNKVWYMQAGAIGAYRLLGSIAIGTGVIIYNKRLRAEKRELEQKVAERTKEILHKNKEITAQSEVILNKNEEILAQVEELKQLSDETASQRDNLLQQKELIEQQNILLEKAKAGLEQNVKERTTELSLSNYELMEQNLQLEQFAFMTAHNLRGPVARLMGLTSIFNSTELADPINKEIINKIQDSANDLDEVIRDIATILQVKKSVAESFSTIKAGLMIRKVLSALHPEIQKKKITVVNTVDHSLSIRGIQPYVYSVFYNVISNSVKYSDDRKWSSINISSLRTDDSVQIAFSDNGIGFDAESQREKLFKPFSRLNSKREGKGLGLYLVKIEMDSMNGGVGIQSQIDVGTTVTLTFQQDLGML
ncbi:MAG: hypothetical protein HYR67_08265 [Bacteroidetes bacterium]|nr:hypothetical protein [Bacteroidota bacterium]